jgi:penicillin G amidase
MPLSQGRAYGVAACRLLGLLFVRYVLLLLSAALLASVLWMIYGGAWPVALPLSALVPLCRHGFPRRLAVSHRLAISLIGSFSLRRDVRFQGADGVIAIQYDGYGIPEIVANSHADALHGLGYCHGRDRLFQMDCLRRSSLGRTAEVFGPSTAMSDVVKRRLGLARVARSAFEALDSTERSLLASYSAGINRAADEQRRRPFEARLLGYEVGQWRQEDAIAVALVLFETLAFDYEAKRGLAIMRAHLSDEEVRLLAAGGTGQEVDLQAAMQVADVLHASQGAPSGKAGPRSGAGEGHAGASNLWAISGRRSATGCGILCNDLHLPLSAPNIFYCARLRFAKFRVAGVQVPGLPITLVGTNGCLSWGAANLGSSCVDLIRVEPLQSAPDSYHGPAGPEPFVTREETIIVKGGPPITIKVDETRFGPVMERDFLGAPVAVRWTALMQHALSLELIHLFGCRTIEQALNLASRSGGPPLSFCVSASSGEVGRTVCGRIPDRRGTAGEMRDARDASWQWSGFVPPGDLPIETDPQDHFFISANQPLYRFHDGAPEKGKFSDGARARRARELLLGEERHSAPGLQVLQLDVQCSRYLFYRDLVLSLDDSMRGESSAPWLAEIVRDAHAWDGSARASSRFFAFLYVFSDLLTAHLVDLYALPCRRLDQNFSFPWSNVDHALQALLSGKFSPPEADPPPQTAPSSESRQNAVALLAAHAQEAYARVYAPSRGRPITWGTLNASAVKHPLSKMVGTDARILNMRSVAQDGCSDTVRVAEPSFGSAGRLILVSGSGEMRVQFPGGESGHPLSRHYADMHERWSRGEWISVALG